MSWGPLKLRTASHGVVFEGEASPAPGGGSMPKQGSYSDVGHTVAVADGDQGSVNFWDIDFGDALLDLTDKQNPTFIEAGTYAVTAILYCTAALTAGGYATCSMAVVGGNTLNLGMAYSANPALDGLGMCGVCVVGAGDTLNITAVNRDGVSSRNYGLGQCIVVKLA